MFPVLVKVKALWLFCPGSRRRGSIRTSLSNLTLYLSCHKTTLVLFVSPINIPVGSVFEILQLSILPSLSFLVRMILQVFWTIPSVSNTMHMGKLFSMSLNQMARVSLLLKKIKKNMSGFMSTGGFYEASRHNSWPCRKDLMK